MAVDGILIDYDAVTESWGNPVSSVENEQADAGREGRTRLAKPNSQARMGTGEKTFSLSS